MTLLLVSAPAAGHAQDRGDERPAATATARSDELGGGKTRKRRAARLTAQAERQYLERDYEAALASYQDAYLAVPAPELLFNLGQCHRQLDHYQEALFFFRVYLRKRPQVEHRATVESLMIEARRKLAHTEAPPTQTKVVIVPANTPLNEAPLAKPGGDAQKDERKLSRRARRWAWAVAGAFVVAGTGAALATTLRKDDGGGATTTGASLGVVDWR